MPQKSKSADAKRVKARKRMPDLRVLLVDPSDDLREQIERCAPARRRVKLVRASGIAEARRQLARGPIDLLFVADVLPDGSGIELAEQVARGRGVTQTIVITDRPNIDAAVAAVRAGVSDLLIRPVDEDRMRGCVEHALSRQSRDQVMSTRVRRLRRLCRKLNQARLDVAEQVDVLCNDLVTAYQELASQMQQVAATSEFGALIRDELDLEQLLRRTLEYVIEKAGATNAAIFLPATMDEYNLGGYVNYDCTSESADMLLEHLADVLAPKVAEHTEPVHVTTNAALRHWIGDDAAYLADSHLLTFPCRHDDEALAVIAMFRDGNEPFDEPLIETCTAVAPLLGDSLARLIRVHHRHLPDPFEGDGAADVDEIPF